MVEKYDKSNYICIFGLVEFVGYFAESQFSPIFRKTLLFLKDLAPRDEAQVHQQFFP